MGRLIDADKLKQHYSWWGGLIGDDYVSELVEQKKVFDTIVDVQPTVDAEPVVRYKDCKFWHTEGQYCDRFGVMWEEFYTSPNDYCSRGERREDAKTDRR